MASPLKAPTPGAYRAAQLLARSRAGALTEEAAKRVVAAVDKYVATLTARVAALPAGTPAARQVALAAAAKLAVETRNEMIASVGKVIADKRDLAFREVYQLWQEAGRKVATAAGVPDALLGAIEQPNLTMAGAFEALGGVPFMKSLTATGKAAGAEVAAILREGITTGIGPDEMARRLRPYVSGADAFEAAFPKSDERLKALHGARARLPKELRGAAGRVRSNSVRIAYSEIHNARAEAELQAYALDPLVGAVRWELSPFRGSQATPDPCDAFAVNDWYGLGAGVYPIDAVPLPPHPRDRCERVPVMRPPDQWGKPKPVGLKRKLKPVKASLGPNAKQLTAAQASALRDTVRGQLQQLDQHSSAVAMRKLVGFGNDAAGELLEIAAARQALLSDLAKAVADAAAPPTVIGLVTFPTNLEGDALTAATALVKKASTKSKTALQALKDAGADTSKLEAKIASWKSNQPGYKAAKKAASVPPPPPAPTPAPPLVAPPPVAPAPAAIETASAENVLAKKVGGQAGSNQGGFYLGQDGVKRYVKVYDDASQAHGEVLANALYRELGLGAPEAFTFQHAGRVYYASRVIDGAENATFGKLGVTADRARKALDGFAADLLTANWDAPGLSFDNLVDVGGKVYRIDNGSAFLFRAQGDRKAKSLLGQLTEWEGFAPGAGTKNPQYAQLFTKAGLSSPEQLGEAFVKQVDAILALEAKAAGWARYVDALVPGMAKPDRDAVVGMLADRAALLKGRRDAIAATLTKHVPAPAPVVAPPPAAVTAASPIDHGALAKTVKMQWASGTAKTAKGIGVVVDPSLLQGKDLGRFKKALVSAARGDEQSLKYLAAKFNADVSGLQKKLGLTPASMAAPQPAVAPVINAVPHVPPTPLVKPSQVPGVQAASSVKEPLYFNASNTTATALKTGGVDLTKLPDGQIGFELSGEQTPLAGVQKQTLKALVVAQKPIYVWDATDTATVMAKLNEVAPSMLKGWKKSMSAAQKRQVLLDNGYDAIIVKSSSGKLTKVVALRPDAVKFVDEVVPPAAPAASTSVAAPAKPKAKPSAPIGARVTGGLGGRTKSTESLAGVADETDQQRKVRELRASLRAALTESDRDYLAANTPTASVSGTPQYRRLQEWREREAIGALVSEAGISRPQAEKVYRAWRGAINEWLGSSSSDGASLMKLAAEDAHGISSTTYHRRYFDHVAAERKRYFLDRAEAKLSAAGITRARARAMYEIDSRLNRAYLMDILGIKEGETFKVWRGVSSGYFQSHHIPVPGVGEEAVLTMNSLSSFSMNRPFYSDVVLELEATIDDVAVQHTLAEGGLGNEAEIWIIGRPRRMKRVK